MPGMKGDELMRTIRAESPQTEIIIITGCGSIETAVEGIRHGVFDYLTKPFDVVQVTASVERALARRESRGRMVSFLEEHQPRPRPRPRGSISRSTSSTRARSRRNVCAPCSPSPCCSAAPLVRGRADRARLEFLEVLAETIESRDLFMRGHARRVAFFADLSPHASASPGRSATTCEWPPSSTTSARSVRPSDVLAGKVLPEPERLESIQDPSGDGRAPAASARTRSPMVTATVRHHHERFDGAGYPDGLAGDGYPARRRASSSLADAFDAMTCDRPYRTAPQPRDEALDELRDEAGRQFDPNLVDLFCNLVESGAIDALEEPAGQRTVPRSSAATSGEIARRRGAA